MRLSLKKKRSKLKKKFLIGYIFILLIAFSAIAYFTINNNLFMNQSISPVPSGLSRDSGGSLSTKDQLIKIFTEKKIAVESLSLASESAIMVKFKTGGEAIFSSLRPLEQQVSSLQRIENRLTIEGKVLKRIDLRFNKPVVSFE